MFYINCTRGENERKKGGRKEGGGSVTWHNPELFMPTENSQQMEANPTKLVLGFLL